MINFQGLCGQTPLWNLSLTWGDTSWPEFTQCFQDSVLIWVPCGFLWLSTLFYFYFLQKLQNGRPPRPITIFSISKVVGSLLLSLLSIVQLVARIGNIPTTTNAVVYISTVIKVLSYILAAILMEFERRKAVFSSGILFIFWSLNVLAGVIPFYSKIEKQENISNQLDFDLYYLTYALILTEFICHCFAETGQRNGYIPLGDDTVPSPEFYASFPSRLTFWWMNKIVKLAYKRPLQVDDIYPLLPDDSADSVITRFDAKLRQEVKRCYQINEKTKKVKAIVDDPLDNYHVGESSRLLKEDVDTDQKRIHSTKKLSLLRVLFWTYGFSILKSLLCRTCAEVFVYIRPLILHYLIGFTESQDAVWKGYTMAVALFAMSSIESVLTNQSLYMNSRISRNIEKSLISAIYKKSLRIKPEERKKYTSGEIVNLMAIDSSSVTVTIDDVWIILLTPLKVFMTFYLLYNILGYAIITGIVIFFLIIPLNSLACYQITKCNKKKMTVKDSRVKLINEVLQGIKVLKLYAWELSFQEKITQIRESELMILKKIAYFQFFTRFAGMCLPFAVILGMFFTYTRISADKQLDAQKVFVSLSLFNTISWLISVFPLVIVDTSQFYVSMSRIKKFFNADEINPHNTTEDPKMAAAIMMEDGSFTWEEDNIILQNISFKVGKGQLVAIVGSVGSGKSSLISAILGEMNKTSGSVYRNGSIAYVSQEAWIQNATLKDNILFGKDEDSFSYDSVIEACALKSDLELFEGGDQTEIGEKGINLSGGQKQRVSLARAVYYNADIYLLDDPLSAVDSHVGKHIFEKVLSKDGLLKNKTRILVTHGIHWLPQMDNIIVITNGRISGIGTYEELLENNETFGEFMKTCHSEEENDNVADDSNVFESEIINEAYPFEYEEDNSTLFPSPSLDINPRKFSVSSAEMSPTYHTKKIIFPVPNKEKSQTDTEKKSQNLSRLTEDEYLETGKVEIAVYLKYLRSMGLIPASLMMIFGVCPHLIRVLSSIWLKVWTEDPFLLNVTNINTTEYTSRTNYYLEIYGVIGAVQSVSVFFFSFISAIALVKASRILHRDMLQCILRTPMSFFDTNPTGRILNRFSKDIEVIDYTLPVIFRAAIVNIFLILSSVLIISINTPIFLAAVFPFAILYIFIQRYYIPISRQLRRISSISTSHIYRHFNETLSGVTCIRAFKIMPEFYAELLKRVDKTQAIKLTNLASNRWLSYRLELMANLATFVTAVLCVAGRDHLNGGQVGLSVMYALDITFYLNLLVVRICSLQTDTVSVERVKEYSHLEPEAPWTIEETKPKKEWPDSGQIEFKKFSMRYREGHQLIIKGISCLIKAKEKVGIVGRTGAGKSSLSLSLFRLIEAASGEIAIDGHCIADMGLHDVRTKLTILPQDPVLFSGSIRMNLDPFDCYSDDEIWLALEQSHMKEKIQALDNGIYYCCDEGGKNFSVGQRQLLCLSRTLLHKTKILILDEATASVDMRTDDLIQQTIRAHFNDCTIMTIAHRLNTIMDYDRIMILDAGEIKEFDSPKKLFQDETSIFFSLAKAAGVVCKSDTGDSR